MNRPYVGNLHMDMRDRTGLHFSIVMAGVMWTKQPHQPGDTN